MARPALLFDLDGTLWDSHPWFAALAGRDRTQAREVALGALRGGKPAATLLRSAGISRTQFARLARGDVLLETYPTVVQTLNALAARRRPLGAVTNLPGWMANAMLEAIDLSRYFGSVVTYERTRRRKPNPEPLALALEELGVEASPLVWYVGDSTGDCQAAAAAGLSFAWASWGYEASAPTDAVRELQSFDEVLAL